VGSVLEWLARDATGSKSTPEHEAKRPNLEAPTHGFPIKEPKVAGGVERRQ
jgi:hypothetical protein